MEAFLILIAIIISVQILLILLFGPDIFDKIFFGILLLLILLPSLLMIITLIASIISNPVFGLVFILICYFFFKLLLSL